MAREMPGFVILLALLLLGTLPAGGMARAETPSMKCLEPVLSDGLGKVPLFSAIPLRDSALGRAWARLAPKARRDFPRLRIERPEDLHITLVYIGSGWSPGQIEAIARDSLIGPKDGILQSSVRPEIFGKNGQVVALRLESVPADWSDRLQAAKLRLNEIGLKSPDAFDSSFKPHISLASSRDSMPDPQVMKRFQEWLEDAGIWNHEFQHLELSAKNTPELMLSYRPEEGGPKYTPLRALCPHWESDFSGLCPDLYRRIPH